MGGFKNALPGETFPTSRLVFATPGDEQCFFGYYDKSPMDATGQKLLCLRTTCTNPLPNDEDRAEVGYWSLADGQWRGLGETAAFNWQQGAMAQWLGPDFSQRIIYNDRRDDRFVSIIVDINSGNEKIIPHPIYTLHPDGCHALAIDFERHYFPRRNYAYSGIVRPKKNQPIVPGDGIFHVDLESGARQKIIDIEEICARAPQSIETGGANTLEHLMFSPSGRRFMFLHRWVLPDGGINTRLYTADRQGGDLRLLLDSGKVTHACWRGDDHITCWGTPGESLGGRIAALRRSPFLGRFILKPLLAGYHRLPHRLAHSPSLTRKLTGAGYLILPDEENANPSALAANAFLRDGHPSWNPVFPAWLLTDTYEDAAGFRDLYLYDTEKENRIDLARLTSPPAFNEPPDNCDLHPRWDFSGRLVCVDSARDNGRRMYVFDVSDLVDSK